MLRDNPYELNNSFPYATHHNTNNQPDHYLNHQEYPRFHEQQLGCYYDNENIHLETVPVLHLNDFLLLSHELHPNVPY